MLRGISPVLSPELIALLSRITPTRRQLRSSPDSTSTTGHAPPSR
jgi:hypothetical protein